MTEENSEEKVEQRSSQWLSAAVSTAGMLGVVFCLLLMLAAPFAVARYRSRLQAAVGEAAHLLTASGGGLAEAAEAVGGLAEVLQTVVTTLEGASGSLEEAQELSSTAYVLLNKQIPETLENTSAALEAVEAASGEIDSMLRAMDAISFITGVEYDPEQPMDEAVSGVAESLDPVSQSMQDVSQSLLDSTDELVTTADSLALLAEQLSPYSENLQNLDQELDSLASLITDTGERLNSASEHFTVWMWISFGVVELVLLWSLLSQVAVYNVGKWVMLEKKEPEEHA
ncbi:MAG: hypothetical protein JXA25_14995 [Anaerolineales bacterium]|nr:hypothetical protein [Anaerolineales bacterium]